MHLYIIRVPAYRARPIQLASRPLIDPHPDDVNRLGIDEESCAVLGPFPFEREGDVGRRLSIRVPSLGSDQF